MKKETKLIIFDLDDCLIDTWGALIPTLIKQSIESMIKAGLKIKSFESAVEKLESINKKSKNGAEAIERFLREQNADLKFLDAGKKGFYNFNFKYKIKQLPGANEMLEKTNATFAIVTKGELNPQVDKLRKAGIDKDLFKKIIAVPNYNKKKYYQELLDELGYSPEDCFVCGDRYETDLAPAKELGIKTIYVPHGRGKFFPVKEGDVDFVVNDLREIISIVNNSIDEEKNGGSRK